MVDKENLFITYYAGLGQQIGMSGGDNILIELARRWTDRLNITIFTGTEGLRVCFRQGLDRIVRFNVCPSSTNFRYIRRMYWSIRKAFEFKEKGTIYTSSDFWHDLFFGLIVKKRLGNKWIAGVYLVAPPPFSRFSPYRGISRIRGIGYWLTQRLTLWIVNRYADIVFVTSEPDRKFFPNKKVVIIRGGVNIPSVPNVSPYEYRLYDAMFMGRFHWQKGVLELIDIWKDVVNMKQGAKLIMVGNGPLKEKCIKKAQELDLMEHITFKDFADDREKILLFYSTRLMLHPAVFESGGMACAEGMAYRIPAVGFNLPVYDTYYPKGMFRVDNEIDFAQVIVRLLNDREMYNELSKDAFDLVTRDWDWNKRANDIWEEIQ